MLYITMSFRSSQRIFFICSVTCHPPRRGSILGWRSHALSMAALSYLINLFVLICFQLCLVFFSILQKARRNHHDDCTNGECCHDADRLQVVHALFFKLIFLLNHVQATSTPIHPPIVLPNTSSSSAMPSPVIYWVVSIATDITKGTSSTHFF